jgi:hypothetical protein
MWYGPGPHQNYGQAGASPGSDLLVDPSGVEIVAPGNLFVATTWSFTRVFVISRNLHRMLAKGD